jgi:aspartyl-tRNA(Asn)/glutamyl-tRNA(Gln) amidotransferase subunit A
LSKAGKKRIAVLKETIHNDHVDEEVVSTIKEQIEAFKKDGHEVEEISFPLLEKMVPTYYVISNAEASSNLSRFDGIHFGYRSEQAQDIESTYVNSRSEGFGAEVKRRIMMGTFVLSAGYYDAYYSKAQKVRRLIKEQTEAILKDFDFILTPTTPHTAFRFGENSDDPVKMYLEDIFTVQANLAGTPAISIPVGTHSNQLPIGLQLMAAPFKEKDLLEFAQYCHQLKTLSN